MKQEDKFVMIRKEMIDFIGKVRNREEYEFSNMDIVDCLLVNWIIPYFKGKS